MGMQSKKYIQTAEDYLYNADALANDSHPSFTDSIARHHLVMEMLAMAQVNATLAVATKDY